MEKAAQSEIAVQRGEASAGKLEVQVGPWNVFATFDIAEDEYLLLKSVMNVRLVLFKAPLVCHLHVYDVAAKTLTYPRHLIDCNNGFPGVRRSQRAVSALSLRQYLSRYHLFRRTVPSVQAFLQHPSNQCSVSATIPSSRPGITSTMATIRQRTAKARLQTSHSRRISR